MAKDLLLDAVRVKAQLLDENGMITNSTKFSLDPEITSYEMLQTLLAKAFDIKGEFVMSYLTVDDEEHIVQLSLLNDWDLDAAILNCQTYLKLIVQIKPADETLKEWDIVVPADIPAQKAELLNKQEKFLNALTDRLRLTNILGRRSRSPSDDHRSTKCPMTDSEFRNFLDSNGRLISERAFRESIYQGGVEPSLRKVTWRHLLNVYPPDLSGKERYEYLQRKSKEYIMLRDRWKSEFRLNKLNMSDEMKFITSMVRKDVIRTDRTHTLYKGREDNKNTESLFDMLCTYSLNHPEVSYCQGMSDLASVLLVVQSDETNAYLCFCAIMKRLKYNFLFDGKAMTCKFDHLKLLLSYYDPQFWTYMIENEVNDLFFTYRWLLLELKREFAFNDALYMLEVMWSTLPVENPPDGVSLSETHCLSADGTTLLAIGPTGTQNGASASGSGTPATPTPYTKLLALCRKPSLQSCNTPVSQDTVKQVISDGFLEDSGSEFTLAQNGDVQLSTSKSRLTNSDSHTSGDQTVLTGSDLETRAGSTFYLSVTEDEEGALQYTDQEEDTCSEAIESVPTVSRTNVNGSLCSEDSGIRSQPDTPHRLPSVSSELQFAFESSGGHSKSQAKTSVFPPPEEFGHGNPFLMFAALTMILQHRDHIIKNKLDFDSIVMLFDRKVRKNNVHKILHHTKVAYQEYVKHDQQTYDYSNEYDGLSI